MATDTRDYQQSMVAAAEFFAARGVFGLVWIDRDLIVRRRFGAMAAFIPEGEPLTNALTPFIGSEDYILSFQQDPKLSLELPGVVIITSAETQDRFNLSLFWDPAQGCYFLLVARASLDATLELELVRHVRARLIAEADTTMKSKELMRANRDLEQFAAIVSHDLKAPMRALQYMTEDMEAAALRGDPIELQARLAQVRTQAQRMSSMLSGLLDYSTVGRKAMAIEDVDTGALARSVSGSIPHGTGMTIDVAGDWPVITTLKAPLDLVLRNLVDNAVKHHDRPTGKIRLECAPVGADVVISVIDNGPGIPPEHQASIFLPFRTLEAAGRPATGLGLGLALVQRTVESVGGRISLGGAGLDGRGTTFLVRWPAAIGASILLS